MNKLEAGTYYVGDLCYVLSEDDYNEIVCTFQYNDGDIYTINGFTFAWAHTAYGDGCYSDSEGNSYPVDAGLIGIIRVDDHPEFLQELLQHNNNLDEDGWRHKHNLFTFDKEFFISFSNGVFNVNGNVINTKDDEDEDGEW